MKQIQFRQEKMYKRLSFLDERRSVRSSRFKVPGFDHGPTNNLLISDLSSWIVGQQSKDLNLIIEWDFESNLCPCCVIPIVF